MTRKTRKVLEIRGFTVSHFKNDKRSRETRILVWENKSCGYNIHFQYLFPNGVWKSYRNEPTKEKTLETCHKRIKRYLKALVKDRMYIHEGSTIHV